MENLSCQHSVNRQSTFWGIRMPGRSAARHSNISVLPFMTLAPECPPPHTIPLVYQCYFWSTHLKFSIFPRSDQTQSQSFQGLCRLQMGPTSIFPGISLSSEPMYGGCARTTGTTIVPLSLMESRGLDLLPCNQWKLLISNWFSFFCRVSKNLLQLWLLVISPFFSVECSPLMECSPFYATKSCEIRHRSIAWRIWHKVDLEKLPDLFRERFPGLPGRCVPHNSQG